MSQWTVELLDPPKKMQGQYNADFNGDDLILYVEEIPIKQTFWFHGFRVFREGVHVLDCFQPSTKMRRGDTLIPKVTLTLHPH